MKMKLNNDPGILFTRLLLQIPLYTAFEPTQCLDLTDFLERRLLLQKVEKLVKVKRVYELVLAFALRWKMKKDRVRGQAQALVRRADYLGFGHRNLGYISDEDYTNPFADTEEQGTLMALPFSGRGSHKRGDGDPRSLVYVPDPEPPVVSPPRPSREVPIFTFDSGAPTSPIQGYEPAEPLQLEFDFQGRPYPSSPSPMFGRDPVDTQLLDSDEMEPLTIREVSERPTGLGITRRPPPGSPPQSPF